MSGLALRVYLDMSLTENQNVKSIRLIRRKEVQSKNWIYTFTSFFENLK